MIKMSYCAIRQTNVYTFSILFLNSSKILLQRLKGCDRMSFKFRLYLFEYNLAAEKLTVLKNAFLWYANFTF